MKTCIIVGQNFPDHTSDRLIVDHDYTWIFEPLPQAAKACRDRYSHAQAMVVNAACGKQNTASWLQVYNVNGLSSSLGNITEQAKSAYSQFDLSCANAIRCRVVNLRDYCLSHMITAIETLIIDAQGMDLTILQTMQSFIESSLINHIECEADGDGFRHYHGVPDNSESAFVEFMSRYPKYDVSRKPDRVAWQPDLVWDLI